MKFLPTASVAASSNEKFAALVQNALSCPSFRVYRSSDPNGVELAGALKNIYAIASGVSDGLKLGNNSRAALLSRSLVEIKRMGILFGMQQKTLLGLAGVGDLFLTSTSSLSRNYRIGISIAEGKKLELKRSVPEGVWSSEVVANFSKSHHIDLPIANAVYKLIYENKKPYDMVVNLMNRSLKKGGPMNKMKVIGASKDTLSKLKDKLYERLKNPETFSDERYKDRLFIKFVKLLCDISYNLAFFSLPASNQFERFYRMYELVKLHKKEEIDVKMVSQDGMAQLYTVSSDMPFLLHTLLEFMRDNNLSVRFVIHPIFGIKYDEDGNAIDIEASSQSGKLVSSVHIDLFGPFDPDKIKNDITLRLKTLKAATSDFHEMKDRLSDAINRIKTYT